MRFENAVFEASFGTSKQLPPSDLPEIAFSGRSNVGKSSVLNKLFNRKSLARVSATPGKTRTVNFFRVDSVRFADLPGYGYAKVPDGERRRWSELMEGYFNQQRDIRLVVQLIDMRHAPSADDMTMLDFLSHTGIPFVIILTKSDKLNKKQREERFDGFSRELSDFGDILTIPVSSVNGEGIDRLKSVIEEAAK